MGAPTKRARKVRVAKEFDPARLSRQIATPKGTSGVALTSWTLAQIFAARDAQLRGHFYQAARMAESMRTDDALAVAFENRLAPQRCIKVEIVAAKGARGAGIAGEAGALFGQAGVGISPDTIASIHSCLVNHDVAFATVTATPRDDGSRVDFALSAWPIEHVRWDSYQNCFVTRVDVDSSETGDSTFGGEIPIVHGDGRWVIFQRFEVDPFKHAAILSAAVVWARHAYAIRDWSKSSVAHGSAKVIGALPANVALQSADGALTPEAEALVAGLRDVATSDSAVVVKPAGSEIQFLTNPSTAWQVWVELVGNAERAAARIYLGTDGTLGTNGGAPGVDIASLFGVAATKVEGDLACISRGLQTGLIEPWCAVNFGDSSLAPTRRYLLADADADAARASFKARNDAFFAHLGEAKKAGFDVTQEYAAKVAKSYGVDAPLLVVKPVDSSAVVAPPALRAVP